MPLDTVWKMRERNWNREFEKCKIHYSDETLEVAYTSSYNGCWEVAYRLADDVEALAAGQVFLLACNIAERGGDPGDYRYVKRGSHYVAEAMV